MKNFFTLVVAFLFVTNVFAQLPDGSIAPDWTLTDLDGTEHHLYEYLDSGYTVVIDFSATWCGPCWGYHTSGNLENLYIEHGPAGYPNVSANTTDDVMVFFIEGDQSTTLADLNGTGPNTQGDWVTGTPYPIINDDNIAGPYAIAYWPTIYTICPSRSVQESGQVSTANHYAVAQACGFAQYDIDAKVVTVLNPESFCGDEYIPEVTLQSLNTGDPMTAATITVSQGSNQLISYDWTGNLDTYEMDDVTLPAIDAANMIEGQDLEFAVVVADDGDMSNNTMNKGFVKYESLGLTIQVMTDKYPKETSWKLTNSAGTVIESVSANDYVTKLHLYETEITLPADDCYVFEIKDVYGDGICCGEGEGFYKLINNAGDVVVTGGDFGKIDVISFTGLVPVSTNEIEDLNNFTVYPNPAHDIATVSFDIASSLTFDVAVVNVLGEQVYTQHLGQLAAGHHTADVPVQDLTVGIYFITLTSNNTSITKQITIEK